MILLLKIKKDEEISVSETSSVIIITFYIYPVLFDCFPPFFLMYDYKSFMKSKHRVLISDEQQMENQGLKILIFPVISTCV